MKEQKEVDDYCNKIYRALARRPAYDWWTLNLVLKHSVELASWSFPNKYK